MVLSRIYTRTGDGGTTALGDGSRVAKGDPRLAAYADVDEANCAIGTALALGQLDSGIAALLTRVQNELFDVGADLCNPVVSDPKYPPLRVEESYVERPGAGVRRVQRGPAHAAQLHPARRHAGGGAAAHRPDGGAPGRAQRLGGPGGLPRLGEPSHRQYLNRLSDLLFILARRANADRGDVLWKPGGER